MRIYFTAFLDLPYTETLTDAEINDWTRDSLRYGDKHQDYSLTVQEILRTEESNPEE